MRDKNRNRISLQQFLLVEELKEDAETEADPSPGTLTTIHEVNETVLESTNREYRAPALQHLSDALSLEDLGTKQHTSEGTSTRFKHSTTSLGLVMHKMSESLRKIDEDDEHDGTQRAQQTSPPERKAKESRDFLEHVII